VEFQQTCTAHCSWCWCVHIFADNSVIATDFAIITQTRPVDRLWNSKSWLCHWQ